MLQFAAKRPGPTVTLGNVAWTSGYKSFFAMAPSTAMTLIMTVRSGDATLFQRADNIEAGWRAVQPILDSGQAILPSDSNHAAGGDGPAAATRCWRATVPRRPLE